MRNALITLGIVLAGWFALGVAASASGEDQTARAFAGMFEGSLWIGGIIIGVMFFREWRKKKNQIKTTPV